PTAHTGAMGKGFPDGRRPLAELDRAGKGRGMMTRLPLGSSYVYCERLARREAGNFYHAFQVLPRPQRRAMCALYAFMRLTDDLADGPGDVGVKQAALARWRDDLRAALAGDGRHALHPALRHAVERYGVPVRHLEDVIDGVEM